MSTRLSFSQLRIWFLERLIPNTAFHNISHCLKVSGDLDVVALDNAMRFLVDRHELFRANVINENNTGQLFINSTSKFKLEFNYYNSLKEKSIEGFLSKHLHEESTRVFDLEKDSLVRAKVLILSEKNYVLIFTFHHIIMDGWSVNIFRKELSIAYNQCVSKKPIELEALELRYTDYVIWEKECFDKDIYASQREYWQKIFHILPHKTDLPYDNIRKIPRSYEGEFINFEINRAEYAVLKKLSGEYQLTISNILLATYVLLLFRYTRQNDVVVGTMCANRNKKEIEPILGLFTNSLALRFDVQPESSILDLFELVQETMIEALSNQNYPFEKLLQTLNVNRDLSSHPIFQTMFICHYLSEDDQKYEFGRTKVKNINITNQPLLLDLILTSKIEKDYIKCSFQFATDVFERETVELLIQNYLLLIKELTNNIQGKKYLKDVKIGVSSYSNEQGTPSIDYTMSLKDKLLESILSTSQNFPHKISILSGSQSITYEEFKCKIHQFSTFLYSHGVRSNAQIGIFLEPSPEVIYAAISAINLGVTFILLDPSSPTARTEYIITDANISILLTSKSLLNKLPALSNLTTLYIEEVRDTLSLNTSAQLSSKNAEVAYIIYTSGSTGRPKGVVIKSNSLLNFLESMLLKPGLNKSDVLLSTTTISFDIALLELLLPIFCGSTVVIATKSERKDPRLLIKIMENVNITVMQATPTLWQMLVNTGWHGKDNLKLLTGGERLTFALSKELLKRSHEVWNMYGPTETTIWSTCTKINKDEPIHLGKPINNTSLYILDSTLRNVPKGAIGELHIAGSGLAVGYLNNISLTKQKFIEYKDDGIHLTLYKTGDLVRQDAFGRLIYIGREDSQCKIRGHRIELEEIEQVLLGYSDIQQACVTIRTNNKDEKTLVAYLVLNQSHASEYQYVRSVKQYIRDILPSYMLPVAYVIIQSMPLTFNGKIDTKSLPTPDWDQFSMEEAHVSATTDLEKVVKILWEELFGTNNISVTSDFFNIGGHSILATELTAKISTHMKLEIPLTYIFEFPSIQTLCAKIEKEKQKGNLTITKARNILNETTDAYALSSAQYRLWIQSQLVDDAAFFNVPFKLTVEGNLDCVKFDEAFSKLSKCHSMLRTAFIDQNGMVFQKVKDSVNFKSKVLVFSKEDVELFDKKCRQIEEKVSNYKFDLSKAPLVYSVIVTLSGVRSVVYMCKHHLITDGWSLNIFARDLSRLYNNKSISVEKDENNLSYIDFISWHSNWLGQDKKSNQLAYWKKQLNGVPELLYIPNDNPRPKLQSYKGGICSSQLSKPIVEKIKKISSQHNCTPFMVLLTLLNVILYRYSRSDNIVIGVPISNRQYAGVKDTIGFFLNTLPIVTKPSNDIIFSDFLCSVKNTLLEGYANQDLPFDELVDELNIKRDMSYHPIFQILFIMDNIADPVFHLTGTQSHYELIKRDTVHHDMVFIISETLEGMTVNIKYMEPLFSNTFINELLNNLIHLCKTFFDKTDQRLIDLSLMDQENEKILLEHWVGDKNPTFENETFKSLFEKQVVSTPDKIALIADGKNYTYDQLNRMANRLAAELKSKISDSDRVVALFLDRSRLFLISMLATFKLGLAYMPLDPEAPVDKLRSIFSQFSDILVLSHLKYRSKLELLKIRNFIIDKYAVPNNHDYLNPGSSTSSSDLAYIIFTSGSTGTPKGVMIRQKGMINHLLAKIIDLKLDINDVIAQTASVTFDISIWQFLVAIIMGGKVCILTNNEILDSRLLVSSVKKNNISVLELVPSQLIVLNDEIEKFGLIQYFSSLRWLMLTGEGLPNKVCRHWHNLFPQIPIVNAYGPTECSDDVTHHIIYDATNYNTAEMPINGTVVNTHIYLLEPSLLPCPDGMIGEIYVSGTGVGMGYLNSTEQTSKAFIQNPFDINAESNILYKTGDLARQRSDGSLEFLGRVDHQVKIRGFRIELSEIESAINSINTVNRCVVLPIKLKEQQRLFAFVESSIDESRNVEADILEHLRSKLPNYMLPNKIIVLSELPLLVNGKVDRSRLIKNYQNQTVTGENIQVLPETLIEKRIYSIWCDVLGLEKFSIDLDFFDLGGTSLMFLKLATRLRMEYDEQLPIALLMQYTTLKEQVSMLDNRDAFKIKAISTIRKMAGVPSVYLIHPITGLSDCYKPLVNLLKNVSIYSVRNPNLGNLSLRKKSMLELAHYYAEKIKHQTNDNVPYILIGWSFGGALALEIGRILQVSSSSPVKVIMLDTYNLSSYSRSPVSYNIAKKLAQELNMTVDQPEFLPLKNEISYNTSLLMQYTPMPYIGEVMLIRATKTENNDGYFKEDRYYGWKDIISPFTYTADLDVKHTEMFSGEHIEELTALINEYIIPATIS